MLLAVDIGNTEVTLGLFKGERLSGQWRLTTVEERTPDEWGAMLTAYLLNAGYSTHEVKAVVLASVAPNVGSVFARGAERAVGVTPVFVTAASPLPIRLDVEDPLTVGADRVVNTLAAVTLFKRDTIVVDFGTATTFDCVTADGRFIGGVIAPGVRTASDQLVRRAAKLFSTELVPPSRVIGRRTEDCVRAGVLFGAADSVDGLIRRIRAEWPAGGQPWVVATGGLAGLIAPLTSEIEKVEPTLTLEGLRIAGQALGLVW